MATMTTVGAHTCAAIRSGFVMLIAARPMTWNTRDNKEAVYVLPERRDPRDRHAAIR